ncbi:pyocin knob domain-containing S74 family peptidase [Rahnella sp. NRRL B-41462]|uniref:pyocin knob domain-containing S74 family peptidase n=1 Tax=Rahnella sp. NRRL B-41462 TaxID=1610579 RepID=UPI000DC2C923|nr:pyocin knob domain-containing S74 family peptidase [Rahnella sp. NRRL B-41462]
MSAGTIALTNNSAAVTGTGTAFTTDLKVGDFIVVIVGGVTYTLGVKTITSATALTLITAYGGPTATGNAWTAVPNATLVGITAQVAADVAKAIRGLNQDKANWQQVFSGTGTITVTLPDGSTYTGPAWNGISATLAKAYNDGGILNATVTPNSLGNTADFNIYYQTANANAIIANGYPIGKAGTLFVTKSAYGCQQMYITFQGEAFVRGLTGNFNSAAPNWSDWWPIFTGKSTIPVANGGTGAATVAAAPFAPKASPSFTGNTSISGNLTVGAGVTAGPAGYYTQGLVNPAVQGSYIGWNGTGLVGGADFLCNRGTGDGGFRFRTVNNTNTAVITDFTMLNTGQGVSSAGWVAVSDIDVKMNVVEIEPEKALSVLTSWRTCSWDYCDVPSEYDEAGKVISVTKGAKGFGFIAQDVQKDCPDAVTLTKNPQLYVAEDGELFAKEDTLSLNTLGVSAAYAGAAIKALKKRNEDQAELISALSERLKQIESTLGINNKPAS